MKPTRKSIGDKNGERSVYVVEWSSGGNIWTPEWKYAGHANYKHAVKRLNESKSNCSCDVRISLYVRAEEK